MTQTIVTAHFTHILYELLDETFEQVRGIYLDKGTSLFETLSTISAEEASRPVSGTGSTVAAQGEHVRFYLEVLESHMIKQPMGKVDWSEIWRSVHAVTPTEWAASQERLRTTYQRVRAAMKTLTWDEDAIGNTLAIVVHTAHHLGEIRQALGVLKAV